MQLKLQWDPLSNKFLCISDILTGLLCAFLVQFLLVAGPWFLGIKNFACWSWSWHMDLSFTELGLVNRKELLVFLYFPLFLLWHIYIPSLSLALFLFLSPLPLHLCASQMPLLRRGWRRMEAGREWLLHWTWWLSQDSELPFNVYSIFSRFLKSVVDLVSIFMQMWKSISCPILNWSISV